MYEIGRNIAKTLVKKTDVLRDFDVIEMNKDRVCKMLVHPNSFINILDYMIIYFRLSCIHSKRVIRLYVSNTLLPIHHHRGISKIILL
jgi:hypothetical protein